MTELEFQSLANEGYNRIPLIAEALADLETPLSLSEIYDDVTLLPLRVREGEDWDADEWVEVELD